MEQSMTVMSSIGSGCWADMMIHWAGTLYQDDRRRTFSDRSARIVARLRGGLQQFLQYYNHARTTAFDRTTRRVDNPARQWHSPGAAGTLSARLCWKGKVSYEVI